jgi:hypothetical protein
MENPMFLQQMNEAMNNPAVVDMMASNPMVSFVCTAASKASDGRLGAQ